MMKYKVKLTKQFRKDLKRIRNSGRFDLEKLRVAMKILERGETLPEQYRNHLLRGYSDYMFECHIEPNWLLLYKKNDDILVLYLIRTGSHSDIF